MALPTHIRIDLSGLHPSIVQEAREIAAARGRPVTLAELAELRQKAEDVRKAYAGETEPVDRAGALPRAIRVGSVTLRTLSLGGAMALRKLLCWAPDMDQEPYDVLLAYIYANSWDVEALAVLVDPDAAAQVAATWSANLDCTVEALHAAIDRLTSDTAPPATPGSEPETDPMRTVDAICKRYGTDPMAALGTPLPLAAHLMHAANEAELDAAAAIAKTSGHQPPVDADPKLKAVDAYTTAVQRMKGEGPADG